MKRLHQTNKPFSPKKSLPSDSDSLTKTQKENTFFFCAFCDSLGLKLFIIHFALFIGGAALHAQSALRQQNETALASAATPVEKAAALTKLGRSTEALALLRDAARLAPDDPAIQLNTAIALDHNGDHAAARRIYDELLGRHQSIWQSYLKARKAGNPPPAPTAYDTRLVALAGSLTEAAALNHVFLGQYDKAASLFAIIHERASVHSSGAATDRAALWRLWLTARMRFAAGMRSAVALETLIISLKVTTPFHEAMLQLYQDRLPWEKVLEVISAMPLDAPAKERHTTEAHFFAAGFYRYVKRDNATALKLLETQDALPPNGLLERLLIRNELQSLKR